MDTITDVTGRGISLLLDDIDTDRIIPARYLRCVTFDGLGDHAFEDDRQQDSQHPFDDDRFSGASVLISGRNFGCGSSREHAPQSLQRYGVRAIIAETFAEIFFGNCTSLGLPAVCLSRDALEALSQRIQESPETSITVDLVSKEVRYDDQTVDLEMPDSARTSLVDGNWDFLGQLLEAKDAIRATAERLPYI